MVKFSNQNKDNYMGESMFIANKQDKKFIEVVLIF